MGAAFMTMAISDSWTGRIRRAERLAADDSAAAPLLRFYLRLLREQKKIFSALDARQPTGSLDVDANQILGIASGLLAMVANAGPDRLAAEAKALLEDSGARRTELLMTYWHERSDRLFFPKAVLQPYAEWLVRAGWNTGPTSAAENRCPRCGGAPQLSVLDAAGELSVDGGSRCLQCATCLAAWPFRRVVCPSCGNDDEKRLGYYQPSASPHVRVDACESCGRYLKTIDRGRLGLAVPLIDEVAAAPLDLWAREQGYEKIELNLVGL